MDNNEITRIKEFLEENSIGYVYDAGKFWFSTKKMDWLLICSGSETVKVFKWKKSDGTLFMSYNQYFDILLSEIKGEKRWNTRFYSQYWWL